MSEEDDRKNLKQIKLLYRPLSKIESFFNWSIWLPLCLYPFYAAYTLSTKYHNSLPKHFFVDGWFGRQQDTSDYEWSFWKKTLQSYIVLLVFYSSSCYAVRHLFPRYLQLFQLVLSCISVIVVSSGPGFMFTLLHALAVYAVLHLKSRKLLWAWCIVVITLMNNNYLWAFQKNYIFTDTKYRNIIHYGTLMSYLRLICYGCEMLTSEKNKLSILDMLCYNFYLPLYFNGPVLTYELFNITEKEKRKINVFEIVRDLATCSVYAVFLEIYFCFSYTSALSFSRLIRQVSSVEIIAIVWTHLHVFFVKYVIFYRFSGTFVKLDGLTPPNSPKCITSLYTFAHMWRYFDKGLYRFLQRDIYIPLGGSRCGMLKQILSSACCFCFIAIWHGGGKTYWLWALFNFFGIALEMIVNISLRKGYFDFMLHGISEHMFRRICAACGAVSVFLLICSNTIFLIGHVASQVIISKLIADWVVLSIILVAFYFTCHCAMDTI